MCRFLVVVLCLVAFFSGTISFAQGNYSLLFDDIATIKSVNLWGELATTGIEAELSQPDSFSIKETNPNPFFPLTTIEYKLTTASDVKITVCNTFGQIVATLVDSHQDAGRYLTAWTGFNQNEEAMSNGVYFYRVEVGDHIIIHKMLLMQ